MAIFSNSESFHQHQIWNVLVQKYVDAHGFVNYKSFKNNETELDEYLDLITQNPPKSSWSTSKKLAYWINAYNAFTVKLIMNNYGVGDIKAIGAAHQQSPFKISFFKIGEEDFTLDRLEHEILRKEFNEPRIHFCLVCASFSCPKFRNEAFIADKLEEQLDDQTSDFINDPDKNSLNHNPIGISSLFQWYWSDFSAYFTDTKSLLNWINKYSKTPINVNDEIEYLPYNCALNGI
ncbi:hypothetical protein A5893_16075 [Pedobacter psychrophilus]|uniref:DUF547 domain-containing protein n=1 Tax=Pedobacter psychrophilus TaxID=1826909 RepID=A0A179DB75_9SPHI|nr:DUF547 domain-containing protein [Pedobacter psychrophilus]OAQ38305.1 hypothetical protein A5893_16075 [Pedobacter psychrophilus]